MKGIEAIPAVAGIYQIRNEANGKTYIGLSGNMHRRVVDHVRKLKNNRHPNQKLQRGWGREPQSFSVAVLTRKVPDESLHDTEARLLCELKPFYNINMGSGLSRQDPSRVTVRKYTAWIGVRLEETEAKALHARALRDGVSESEVSRRAIRKYLGLD